MEAAVGRNCHIHLVFLQASPLMTHGIQQRVQRTRGNPLQLQSCIKPCMPVLLISVHTDTQFCFPEPVYPKTSGLATTLSQDRAEVHTGVRCKYSQIFRTGTWWSLVRGTATQGSMLVFSLPPSPQEPVKHSYGWANPLTAAISEGQSFTQG